jgi:hypothetical protein
VPHCLVSLISEQTIPNILLIKTLEDVDHYLFIATPKQYPAASLNGPKRFVLKPLTISW